MIYFKVRGVFHPKAGCDEYEKILFEKNQP